MCLGLGTVPFKPMLSSAATREPLLSRTTKDICCATVSSNYCHYFDYFAYYVLYLYLFLSIKSM